MPGFPFPSVGPGDYGSPPSPSLPPSDDRYYGQLRLTAIPLRRFARRSRSDTCFCSIRKWLSLPSSRVAPVSLCPALRPRWFPAHSPCRAQDCCLVPVGKLRLWGAFIFAPYPFDHDHTHFRGSITRPMLSLPPVPDLPCGLARGVRY